jgi:hypothetical protein
MKRPGVSALTALELMDMEILQGEMRIFRKREQADPFAAFSERYGVQLPKRSRKRHRPSQKTNRRNTNRSPPGPYGRTVL